MKVKRTLCIMTVFALTLTLWPMCSVMAEDEMLVENTDLTAYSDEMVSDTETETETDAVFSDISDPNDMSVQDDVYVEEEIYAGEEEEPEIFIEDDIQPIEQDLSGAPLQMEDGYQDIIAREPYFEVNGQPVDAGSLELMSDEMETSVRLCLGSMEQNVDSFIKWEPTLFDSNGVGYAAEEGSQYILNESDPYLLTVYGWEMSQYDELEILVSQHAEDGSILWSGSVRFSLTDQFVSQIEVVSGNQAESIAEMPKYADFYLEKYIAGLYCDPENAAYYGRIMNYISGKTKSPADVVVDDLGKNTTFAASVATWKAATFDLSDIAGDAISEVDYYEAILIAIMECSIKNDGYESLCSALGTSYTAQIKSILSDSMEGTYELSALLKKNKYTDGEKGSIVEGFSEWLKQCHPTLSDATSIVDNIGKGMSAGVSLNNMIKRMAEYVSLYYCVDNAQKEFLNQMYANCPKDNLQLTTALARLCNCCNSKQGLFTEIGWKLISTAGEMTYSEAVGALWDGMIEGTPLVVLELSRKLSQSFSNLMFATDETIEQFYKLRAVCQIENLLYSTLSKMINNYRNDSSLVNAEVLNSTVNQLFSLYDISCDYTNTFADIVMTKGLLSAALSDKNAYVKFKHDVESLNQYARQDQNALRTEYLIFLEEDYPDIYEELNIEINASPYIPVESIRVPDSISIDMSSDLPFGTVNAIISPIDATNKTLIYTSGDESIVTVDDIGWITPVKVGETTVTVDAADGVSEVVRVSVTDGSAGGEDVPSEDLIGEGSCGENVKWKETMDGTLYIYGQGKMKDYKYYSTSPWGEDIKKLVISSGVTHIGKYAFWKCSNLTGDLNFPAELTSIGESAFYGCSDLSGSLSFSAGLTSIEDSAFEGCSSLTGGLSFPEGLTSIGDSAFEGCSGLTGGLSFPEGLTSIGRSAFEGCSSLTGGLSFLEGLTSIGDRAFYGCSSLSGSLSFSEGLTSIGYSAFEGCSSLTGGLNFQEGLMSLGGQAFYGCSGLSGSLSFPEGLMSIEAYTFYECSGLNSVSFPEGLTSIGVRAFSGCSNLAGDLSFPEGLTSIGDEAFFECSNLTGGLSFPKGLTSIGNSAFSGCSNLAGDLSFPEGLTSIGDEAFYECSSLIGGLSFPKGLASIGNSAFSGCSNLAGNLSFPEGLTSIGDEAFYECSSLTGGLSFPEELTSIGRRAFDGCYSLTGGLSIPEGLTSIEAQTFIGCFGINRVNFPEGLTSIGDGAFFLCTGLKSVSFPKGLTSIGYSAFERCRSLTGGLSFPEGLTSIGGRAFYGCSGLCGSLSFSEGLTSIGYSAFEGCSSLTGGLSFPEGLTSIGYSAFEGCSSLTGGLSFPEGLTCVDWNVFEGCSSLTGSLSFPEGLTSIERMAFYGCSGLSGSLSFPEGLTSIGDQAFCGCSSLTGGLSFPEGLTSIESYTFCGCRGLKSVSFSKGLTSIGNGAFSGCSGLTGELDFPEDLTSIGENAFEGCSSLTCALSFPEGLTSIEAYTFYECSGLNSVSFPEGLTSIGFRAFYGCNGLKSVSFSEGLTNIGDEAFYECSSLTGGLSFPKGLTSIGVRAFSGCSNLTGDLSLPEGLTSIGAGAFRECSSLTGGLNFPEGLTSIESCTFFGCRGLKNVSFSEGLTSIGYSAFEGCSSLTGGLSFPEGLTSIGYRAFYRCSGLESVSFPKGLTSIEAYTFHKCSGLNSVSFPEGLTSIGIGAFMRCRLDNIKVPESVSKIDDYSLGYMDYYEKMNDFIIIGKKGSAAETYALENGFIFLDEDAPAPNTPVPTEPSTEPTEPSTESTTKPDTSSTPLPNVSSGNQSGSITPGVPPVAVQKGKSIQLSAEDLLSGVAGNSVTWSSSDPNVAAVDDSGKVIGKGYGTVTITVAATDGSGRTAQCNLTIGYGITYKLKGGKNDDGNPTAYYKSAVKLENPSRKGYAFKGWYTDKKCKKKLTKIKASSKKNLTLYAKWQKIKVGGTRITSLKNKAGKKATLKFRKVGNVTGYEIVYSTDKKFRKNCKTISTKKISVTLRKLEKGKIYFAKVRAYKKDSAGNRVYGKYSVLKQIKIKK